MLGLGYCWWHACADRFGSIGDDGQTGFAGSDPEGNGSTVGTTTTYSATTQASTTGIQCQALPPSPLDCGRSKLAIEYDAAGCPARYACQNATTVIDTTAPNTGASGGSKYTTTTIDNATCVTDGCWVSCAFVHGGGGAPSTTMVGNTSCVASASGGATQTTTHIDNAGCISNGCWTLCNWANSSGGSTSYTHVGNTVCEPPGGSGTSTNPPSSGGSTASSSIATATCVDDGCIASCAFVNGGGGAPSTTVIGDTSCNTAGGSGSHSTTTVGDASCYTRGCQTYCMFPQNMGGTGNGNLDIVGNTGCNVEQSEQGAFTTSTHRYSVANGGAPSSGPSLN